MWNDTVSLVLLAGCCGIAIGAALDSLSLMRGLTRMLMRVVVRVLMQPLRRRPALADAPVADGALTPPAEPQASSTSTSLTVIPAPVDAGSCWPWIPLPGNRLELGDTGFWIQLDPRHPSGHYQVYGPEGSCMATGYDLGALQGYVQRRAAERAQFEFRHDVMQALRSWITPNR